ncbi:rnhA, partial [Mucuna pruriens]
MSFELKNAGATYQRAMVTLFHDMMHKEIEYKLRLNPTKCTFGVKTGKLLGFVVDPDKVKAIRKMPVPKSELEVKGFLGRINFIARFISQNKRWNRTQNSRRLLTRSSGTWKIPQSSYRQRHGDVDTLLDSVGKIYGLHARAARRHREKGTIYYLSKKFTNCEKRYSILERTCCTLVWTTKRLRPYMLSYTTWLVAKNDPVKYIFEKPALTGRIARWQMALSEYDILYVNQTAVKGSALADQLAYHPSPDTEPWSHEFPDEHLMVTAADKTQHFDEWTMWFDGASNVVGNGVGVVLISPGDQCFPFAAKLGFDCTNNMAEYEACTMGLLMALEFQVKRLKVFGDSALVIYQLRGEWETRDAKLIPYHDHVRDIMIAFDAVTFCHVPRKENQMADALATLSAMVQVNEGQEMTIQVR